MLTGHTTRAAVLEGLAGGADGYITEPFEPDRSSQPSAPSSAWNSNPFSLAQDRARSSRAHFTFSGT
jgi:DNA-binding NarL/FixJ family response regulator